MSEGWIKLHRCLQDNPMWLTEPFTRGQAWVDLLMLANHEEGYIRVAGQRIDIKRGQCGWSILNLSKRWKWSRGKTNRFLNELKKDSQIDIKTDTRNSIITICNYSIYQDKDTTDDTTDSTTNGQQTDIKQYTNKNDKKNKNVKKEEEGKGVATLAPCKEMIEIWNEEFQKVIKPNSNGVQLTKPRSVKLAKQFKESFKDSLQEWRVYCQKIRDSRFLSGDNDRGWTADIDWVLEPKNLTKILEGKYEHAEQTRTNHGKPNAHDNVTEGIKLLLSRRAGQQEH